MPRGAASGQLVSHAEKVRVCVTDILVMADAFNEEDAQLWLLRLDVLHKKLPPVDGAVCGIQNAHSAALVEEIV